MSVQMAVSAPQGLHWLGSSPNSLISFRAVSGIALIRHLVQSCCFSALLAETALMGANPPIQHCQDTLEHAGQGLDSQMWQSSWNQLGSKLPFSKKGGESLAEEAQVLLEKSTGINCEHWGREKHQSDLGLLGKSTALGKELLEHRESDPYWCSQLFNL